MPFPEAMQKQFPVLKQVRGECRDNVSLFSGYFGLPSGNSYIPLS